MVFDCNHVIMVGLIIRHKSKVVIVQTAKEKIIYILWCTNYVHRMNCIITVVGVLYVNYLSSVVEGGIILNTQLLFQ